jgi:hypothetical protein
VIGQRQLEQDAVDTLVSVEALEQLGELRLWNVAARLMVEGLDPDLSTVLALHPHVDGGGGVVADEDRGETGRDAFRAQLLNLARDPLTNLRRDGLAVDDPR